MDSTTTAVLFPGAGPTRAGEMGRFLVINPHARRWLAAADDALGYSLLDRLRESGDVYNEYTQTVFVLASLALNEQAEAAHGLKPVVCGGASYGEFAAVVRSGALALADMVQLVMSIVRTEAEYFTHQHQDLVSQFVVRTPETALPDILDGLWYDTSGHFDADIHLITLRERDLPEFTSRVRTAGGYALTTMRPAAHSSVLGGLRERIANEVMPRFDFQDPALPIISDQDGELITESAGVAKLLLDSTVTTVRLPSLVQRLTRLRVGHVLLAGPDHLLFRLPALVGGFNLIRADVKDALRPRRPHRRVPAVAT